MAFMLCTNLVAQEEPELDENSAIQEAKWYEPFFIEVAGQYYFTPGYFSEIIKPSFGFRGALGYEYKRFRFALESGYSHLTGTDPLVLEMGFVPLVFKFGYALPIYSVFGIQADLNAGVALAKVTHYPTAIDIAMDNAQVDHEKSFIAGGRLYATVTPWPYLGFYAGGGTDVIFEKDGPLFLPLIEIGIHFKPFAIPKKAPKPIEETVELPHEEPTEEIITKREELVEEISTIIEEQQITGVTAEATDEGVMIRLSDIQFRADSAELPNSERLKLQEIANILKNIPEIKLRVEGHTARAGNERSQIELSSQRAQSVAFYLISLGAVKSSNITVVGHGANRPIADNATPAGMAANRRVEIIILEN
jgi:outer membrane protein OmpA-like peptidoglycan-associated protein